MSHILLTFLGRVPRKDNSYRTTRYDYGDGRDEPPTAFFGWSLQRRLRPDRLVILGTSGSIWDHLFEFGQWTPVGQATAFAGAGERW